MGGLRAKGPRLKIVHLLPSLIVGGAERAAIGLANWQASHGNYVSLAVGWKDPNDVLRNSLDPTVRIEYIGPSQRNRYLHGLWWVWRRRRWLADQDVVHVHLIYGAVLATALYAFRALGRQPRPAIIETYHAVAMPISRGQQWLHTQMLKMRDAAVLMAEDPHWRKFREGRTSPRIALIPNGLPQPACLAKDDPAVRDYRSSSGLADRSVVVAHLGRLVAERRPELILQVFARVAGQTNEGVSFLFVGAGPEESRLKALARELNIDRRLRFPGLARDPSAAFAAMDVFLTINAGTVTGLAGVHAALCGVPIVAVQLDPEYRPTERDWIWSSSDLDAVAQEVCRIASDAQGRSALAARQKKFARANLTVESMGGAYAELYEQLRS